MKDDPIWETRDGRELPLSEMFPQHIENARRSIKGWAHHEADPDLKRELKSWTRRFSKELRQRAKEWREKHR